MLDIKFVRDNEDLVAMAAKKKHIDFDVAALVAVDDKRRALMTSIERRRSEQNEASLKIARANTAELSLILEQMKFVKENMAKDEESLKPVMKEWQTLMLAAPNIPDMSVPDGESDADNKEMKSWGERQTFNFEPLSHVDLMKKHGMADFERGAKVAGFRGYFLKDDGARLTFAVWNYALKFFGDRGFSLIFAPSLVKKENLFGSGYLPQGEEDLYKTQDGQYLAGTSEVAVMGYFADEVFEKKDLPKKILAFSPCFRREAGSHGKDVSGLIRVHEFFKFEQVVLCEASHEVSVKFHEEINRNVEEFIESLGIPYRTVTNCGGDLGLGQVKKYDIELWVPKEGKYREISSASYFHDFQTRRLGIRYKDANGKMRFAHSLNSTAIPTPRILVSLIENFQQKDGSIKIPEALVPFMGKKVIS